VAYNTSAQINAEIFNMAPDLYQSVRRELLAKATVTTSAELHEANQALLQAACDAVIDEAQIDLGLDHRALWQAIWPRIVYAGTRASKATGEINSMRALVPMFKDLDHFSPERFGVGVGRKNSVSHRRTWHKERFWTFGISAANPNSLAMDVLV
jgi:hypothetical protein